MDKQLIEYFIEQTNKKFDEVKCEINHANRKIDTILEFKWRIAGGLAVLSILVTVGIQVLFKLKGS